MSGNSGRLAFLSMFFTLAACGSSGSEALAPAMLSVSGGGAYDGLPGGPFHPAETLLAVEGASDKHVEWRATSTADWLRPSPTMGVLLPGEHVEVAAMLDAAAAAALPVGAYTGSIEFHDANGQLIDTSDPLELTIHGGEPELSWEPAVPFRPVGLVGGPYLPAVRETVVHNTNAYPIAWYISTTAPWLTVDGPTSGLIAPTERVELDLRVVEAVADGLAAGTYDASIELVLTTDGETRLASRTARLELVDGPSRTWTELAPSADTRRVYVSSSHGDDDHDGLSESTPKRSIAAGVELLRDGMPDWLLLARGDVWTGERLSANWTRSGRSPSERMVVTSYGTGERPVLRTGGSSALVSVSPTEQGSEPVSHVAFVGLRFHAHDRQGQNSAGIAWLRGGANVLVEDCSIEGYKTNIEFPEWGGPKHGVELRRNVLVDAYYIGNATDGHGIFLSGTPGALIEENVLDRNGWTAEIPGTPFRHSIYVTGSSVDVTVRGNIISDGSAHGLQLRLGGTVEDNLFVRCAIAMLVGGGDEPPPGGVEALIRRNVVLDGKDIVDGVEERGWGIDLANIAQGTVSDNVLAHQTDGGFPLAMNLYGATSGSGVHDLSIVGNTIYDWGGKLLFHGAAGQLTDIELVGNDIQDLLTGDYLIHQLDPSSSQEIDSASNRFFRASPPLGNWMQIGPDSLSLDDWREAVGDVSSSAFEVAYPDVERDLPRYQAELGAAATHGEFMRAAREQARSHWDPAYTARSVNVFVRAGFGLPLQ